MGVRDSESGMAPAQVCNGRNQRLQMIEPLHDHCQSLDELSALLHQIGCLEERPRCCVSLKEPIIEQARRRVCHRRNFQPALSDECFLFRGHWMLQSSRLTRRSQMSRPPAWNRRSRSDEQMACAWKESKLRRGSK